MRKSIRFFILRPRFIVSETALSVSIQFRKAFQSNLFMDNTFVNRLEKHQTADGSDSLYLPKLDEYYHSKHGAIREGRHVFIDKGLRYFKDNFQDQQNPVNILEIGFGTGLNALLSLQFAREHKLEINYSSVEAYPLAPEKIDALNYPSHLNLSRKLTGAFQDIHAAAWEKETQITKNFNLIKHRAFFQDIHRKNEFDLIFYDAFGARVQPELWTEELIAQIAKGLKKPGAIVTYAAKGNFKRACKNLGYKLEKLEGPPGKREMMRGTQE